MDTNKPLDGKIAVVAGATRGAGRGIACMLGEAGAAVYCASRSVRGQTSGRPETIEDTAEMVTARGGHGISWQADLTIDSQVRALFDRVGSEHGRLDLLVNNVNGDDLTDWSHSFWEQSVETGLQMIQRGVHAHIRTTQAAIPLMIRNGHGLIVGISDKGSMSFYYGFVKASVMKMPELLAPELRPHNIAMVAVTPGFLRSEAMLEHFGVTEANWRDAAQKDPYFAGSETPFYVGRAVAALAADPRVMMKTGGTYASWDLAYEYGFTDVDGAKPHWERFMASATDEKWEKLTKQVRAEFKKHGLDPAVYLEDDRATLTLRAKLVQNGEEPRWYKRVVNPVDLFHGSAKRVAAEFYEEYARLR